MLDNRRLATQRAIWGGVFAALSTMAYYGAYAYIVWRTVDGEFTLGDLAFLVRLVPAGSRPVRSRS